MNIKSALHEGGPKVAQRWPKGGPKVAKRWPKGGPKVAVVGLVVAAKVVVVA